MSPAKEYQGRLDVNVYKRTNGDQAYAPKELRDMFQKGDLLTVALVTCLLLACYDTHPSPSERFRLIQQLGLGGHPPAFEDDYPVWDLLPNAAALQREMTDRVQANIDAKEVGS